MRQPQSLIHHPAAQRNQAGFKNDSNHLQCIKQLQLLWHACGQTIPFAVTREGERERETETEIQPEGCHLRGHVDVAQLLVRL